MADSGQDTRARLMLLDAASLYFRAFHGVPDRRSSSDQPPTNAVRGFLDMVATLVTRYRPTHLVACWDDDWRPQFRVDLIPSYKAHRVAQETAYEGVPDEQEAPDELEVQVPVIARALEVLGIARVGVLGHEADDVIGSYAQQWSDRADVLVVTGDRDLFQLVDDARGVRVLYTARGGVRDADVVDEAFLTQKYRVADGTAYGQMSILRGDTSDGLPGVAGIGEKTAADLIERFGTVEAVRVAAADPSSPGLTPARRRRIVEAADYLDVAGDVVLVRRGLELPAAEPLLPIPDAAAFAAFADEVGLGTTADRVLAALTVTT